MQEKNDLLLPIHCFNLFYADSRIFSIIVRVII